MKLICTLKHFGHTPYFNDLNPFMFFYEICFMAQNMVYLVNVPYALEKNVYSAVVGWHVLEMPFQVG